MGGFRIRGVFQNYLSRGTDVIQAAVLGAIRLRHFAFSLLMLSIRLQWVVPWLALTVDKRSRVAHSSPAVPLL